jgi:hypothetical protein
MVLAPMGLRLLNHLSLSRNGQPCWDCGRVPADEEDQQAVRLGFNCRACFDRGTTELKELLWHTEINPSGIPSGITEEMLRSAEREIRAKL